MAFSLRGMLTGSALLLLPVFARAQDAATITGRVTTTGNAPVGSVTVSIPELGVGTFTSEAGSYSMTVPAGRVNRQTVTITARRVGYKQQQARITINPGPITQDFLLEANPLQLGEVVITGAGTATSVEKLGNVRNTVSPELIV